MKTIFTLPIIALVAILTVTSCQDTTEPPAETLVNPNDANAIAQVLIMPSGTQKNTEQPPAPTGQGAPGVSRQYSGRTQNVNRVTVVTFTKNGSTFSF